MGAPRRDDAASLGHHVARGNHVGWLLALRAALVVTAGYAATQWYRTRTT